MRSVAGQFVSSEKVAYCVKNFFVKKKFYEENNKQLFCETILG